MIVTARAAATRGFAPAGPAQHVERVTVVVIATAWVAMAVHDLGPTHPHPGVGSRMPGWAVMVVAMMGPIVLPAIVHVAGSSLRWRRNRAALEFTAAYLAIWLVFGAVLMAIAPLTFERGVAAVPVLVLVLAAGALWQVSPAKVRTLRNCHRSIPLPPTGLRATAACARFGWVHGLACLGTCWPTMAVMAIVPSGHLLWSLALTPVLLAERRAIRPKRAARLVGLAFACAALAVWTFAA